MTGLTSNVVLVPCSVQGAARNSEILNFPKPKELNRKPYFEFASPAVWAAKPKPPMLLAALARHAKTDQGSGFNIEVGMTRNNIPV